MHLKQHVMHLKHFVSNVSNCGDIGVCDVARSYSSYLFKVLKASLAINDHMPISYEVCNTLGLSTGYYCNICNKALNPVHDLNDVLLFAFSNYSRSLPIEFNASRLLGGGSTMLMKWPAFQGWVTVLP